MVKNNMRKMFLVFGCTLSVISVCWHAAAAQVKSESTPSQTQKIATEPTNCEFNIAILDATHAQAGSDSLVIIIVRLGQRESRNGLSRRRLHNVRTYLEEFAGRKPQTLITGEGDRVEGYGLIELYVKGQHFYTLKVRNNFDLVVGQCSYDINNPCKLKRESKLYPCLDKNSPQKKIGQASNSKDVFNMQPSPKMVPLKSTVGLERMAVMRR